MSALTIAPVSEKTLPLLPASPVSNLYTLIYQASEAYLKKMADENDEAEIHSFGNIAREWNDCDDLDERDDDVEQEIRAILNGLSAPIGTFETLKRDEEAWGDLISDLINLWLEWDDGEQDDSESDDE